MEEERPVNKRLTVATVNWYSVDFIDSLFSNLSKKAKNPDQIRYIVIDNTNGADKEVERLGRFGLCIKIYPNDTASEMGSFAHAMGLNLALSKLETEYSLIVDPDVYVFKDNWDSFCIKKIESEGCFSVGTTYPKWQLGAYHNFPNPVFCFFRTADYRSMKADWTAYSKNPLINFYNFARRQIVRCCLFISRRKYQRYGFLRRTGTNLERLIGVCSPDTGCRIARKAKRDRIKTVLFQAVLPDELPAGASEALRNIAAEFELYCLGNEPILTHKYGTGSWVFRTAKGHDSSYWREQIQIYEKQQENREA
jgi:hypothetical protein